MNSGPIAQRFLSGLVVMVLLGLSGCLTANREWVQEQLAPVQVQVAEMRNRVSVVEEQVRRYPDQWLWIHKRWRTQPLGEKNFYEKIA